MQQQCSNGVLTLSGEVDNCSITREDCRNFVRHMRSGVQKIVFTQITRIDSAGVALLICARRISKNAPLTISGAPAALGDLLHLYQLNEWISLS